MQNINELKGILKGIECDGIINEMETAYLQEWVDSNRSLSYEGYRLELISMIDKALEDKVLTEQELKEILLQCDRCVRADHISLAKIRELNGIIDGIICDDEVNKSEIYSLREWMNVNKDTIAEYKMPHAISEMIDHILEDNIVTKEEQEQLKQMLFVHMTANQLETKINLLKEDIRNQKNIGIELIELMDNALYIDKIHNRAESELKKTLDSYSGTYVSDPDIVFISLVLIAMMYYDGAFYEHMREIYRNLYDNFSDQKIEGLIRTVLNRYRRNIKREELGKRIINIVLENAIVPSVFLASFFDFIYDIYKINFEYDIPDDLYSEFRFIYEGLKNNMISGGDEVEIKVTRKSYKLIKSTKTLFIDDSNIDAIINFSIIVVRLIDSIIWNDNVEIHNGYLKSGAETWMETLDKERKTVVERKKSEFRSRWEPKFVLKEDGIYIIPPIHRIKAQYDYRNIRVLVKNGEKTIYENICPDIREIIGGYQISVDSVYINEPIGDISYMLMDGENTIYKSGTRLHRKFIVFDENGREIKNNTDYSGNVIVCADDIAEGFQELDILEYYSLSYKKVLLGEVINIGGNLFSFASLIKPGVIGEKYDGCYLVSDEADKEIPVYQSVKSLIYECDKKYDRFIIKINDHNNRLEDFEYTIVENRNTRRYDVKLADLESGIYSIEVNAVCDGKNKRIVHTDFALDSRLSTETVQNEQNSYYLMVESDLLKETFIDEIRIPDFKEDLVRITYNGKNYIYYIPLNLKMYRIDSGSWKSFDEEIWIGDITGNSVIDVYGSVYERINIIAENGEILETVSLKDNGICKTGMIGFIVSYKISHGYIILSYESDGQARDRIYCYNRCVIDEEKTNVIYNHKLKYLEVLPRYFGKGDVFFKITDDEGNEICRSEVIKNNTRYSVSALESFKDYNVIFCEKEKGISLKKERTLAEKSICIYAREDFIGRAFKIKEVYFDQYIGGEFIRKKYEFDRTYVQIDEMINYDKFRGNIYVETWNGRFWLYNINPVEIEICSDVIDNIIETAMSKNGDGLLLDFRHHGILNSVDDDSATDIYSYSIEVEGVQQV